MNIEFCCFASPGVPEKMTIKNNFQEIQKSKLAYPAGYATDVY